MTTAELAQRLGVAAEQAAYLDALDDVQRNRLAVLVDQARQRYHDEIMQGVEEAASHLPRLLRGTFRKMFK